ncbi:MAG TPA: ComF family protein [Pseudomonadota bacterium]|jgi:ComF family protein|nr:ComF family protein [Pseudomonadota bacterium]
MVTDVLVRAARLALGAATDLIWPRSCAGCAEESPVFDPFFAELLCEPCAATVTTCKSLPSCPRCAAPLPEPAASSPAQSCRDCRRLSPALASIAAAYLYDGALPQVVQQLKWQHRDDLARPLGRLLTPLLRQHLSQVDVIIPVPLHPRRLRARGYNQSTLLLRAALSGLPRPHPPILHDALVRQHDTTPTRAHSPAARQAQVAAAFTLKKSATKALAGRRVLLIDDVVTTGATVSACATTLAEAQVQTTYALALLRTPSP